MFLWLAGCDFAPTGEDWSSQLSPSGPCYEADLLDGLDETSTAELHALYACLNGDGALDAYAGLDAALDADTRDGPVGIVLARWVNDLPSLDVDVAAALDGAVAVLEDPADLLLGARIALELIYAEPYAALGVDVPLNSSVSLENGLLVPALPTAGAVAGVVLDDELAPLAPIVELLRSDALRQLAWTGALAASSTDPALAAFAEAWPDDVADAVFRTRDATNDRWADASGDSLRDLAAALFTRTGNDGRPVMEHLGDPLRPVLADVEVRDRLETAVRDAVAADRLVKVPVELAYLASVDSFGGVLSDGEDSALVALVRLLHDGNTEVVCTIDLVVYQWDIELGNLSVSLLQRFAEADPDTTVSSVALLGDVLGFSLTDDLLDAVADSGTCPVIDAQLVADLHALDRFNDAGAGEVLYVLVDVLAAFDDRIPELVDLLSTAHELDVVEPGEEVLRDLAGAPLLDDVLGLAPVLLDPEDHLDADAFPDGLHPADFDDAWAMIEAVLHEDEDGQTDLGRLGSVMNATMAQEGTWTAVGNLAHLLASDGAEVTGALPRLAEVLAEDPWLATADDLADALEDPALVRAPLVLVEAEAPRDALGSTELTRPGPLPFTAQLVVGGTLDVWLTTLRWLARLLPEDS
ncbi:MAG: hypothetical protein ACOZNI_05855 [Myxococcota bacterium]